MEEQRQQPQAPLSIDWNRQFQQDSPPREVVIVPSSTMASDQDDLSAIPDHKLKESIQSKKRTLDVTGKNLPDNGAKLRATIDRYQQELSRRESMRLSKEVDGDQKPQPEQTTSSSAITKGVSNDMREEALSSQVQPLSTFTSCFFKKMEDSTSCTAAEAFKKEKSQFKHCENQKIQENAASDAFGKETSHVNHSDNRKITNRGTPRRRKRHRSSSRQLPFQCPSKLSKHDTFSDDKTCRATSTFSLRNIGRNLSRCYPKVKDVSEAIQLDGSRSKKGQPIVLDVDDDDDEAHIVEKTENQFPEYLKDAKIYFPSRDDPECVEICYKDTDCLAPEGYLTSTIMNFYIQYLQQQVLLTTDYHFFNTYFYKKLKEAVSYKQSDRDVIFAKFRRWWKGVNIFQKAYVLIPIHEDLHWSLIIICIPDKEDESGPIILHLDSLGLHSSKSVFDNIKSYLIEEKNYMDQEDVSSNVSIADRIWKCLPRRIECQIIAVPQQKNEYDCGLFVLYFIERFMEEAPERLKKKDLAMFGKRWFKPEEASNLRVKIRKLLVEKLENSMMDNCDLESSSPSSSGGLATECVESAKDSMA
ncbi:ubiquitin-like-specific protease 1D isoform X2 [Vigna unguiculata]|uniref:Sentrin-specific protease 7 n=1 Tax=Vigna unguiculata TaxID=3917 RepID=A0A4D6L1A6_VIGUN|nr:ubiquitin-like-specific protease 1D isoform X2 [Vigna unguiculata]QCD82273.1 sentrin-specific protease 7 [Vigna unguiculata]